MITLDIQHSPDARWARASFYNKLGSWVSSALQDNRNLPPSDVHDQCTYMTAWEPYIREFRDMRALAFMKQQRDLVGAHFITNGQWTNGYWNVHEAHHGTEHFELFLGTLYHLDPDDDITAQYLVDAALHIGNWNPESPPWFDYETGLFRSMYTGSVDVRTGAGMELNIPDHLRFVNICLLAYNIRREQRYLSFATDYALRWAEAILANPFLPIGLLPNGPVFQLSGDAETAYRQFAGMAGHLDDNLDRAENLLASNAIGAFLRLWTVTGEDHLKKAVERLLDILVTQLDDPDAGPAADAVRLYRRITEDQRYDATVLKVVDNLHPAYINTLSIDAFVKRTSRPHGVGKRIDMPGWYENGLPRRHNPILLAVAAEIAQDREMATHALDLARTMFELAVLVYPDGRRHGCAANTISAIARGHGRDNNAGMVTAVLDALEFSQ